MKRLTALLLCLTLLCAVPLCAGATQEEEEEETLAFSIPAAIERLPDETLMGFFTDSVFVGDFCPTLDVKNCEGRVCDSLTEECLGIRLNCCSDLIIC